MSHHADSFPEKDTQPSLSKKQREAVLERYGIESVDNITTEILMQLAHRGFESFEGSDEFRGGLVRATEDAYIRASRKVAVPTALILAIEDASHYIVSEFEYRSSPDLLEEVLPHYIDYVVDLFAAYSSCGVDSAAYIQATGDYSGHPSSGEA